MQKWIIGLLASIMVAGCAPNFETEITSLERSFEDQRSAVASSDGSAFLLSLEAMVRLMKRTMKAIDQMPAADQLAAARRFVEVGDAGEKLYYSNDFRRFMDGEIQSNGEADRIQSVFNKLKALNLNDWFASKNSMSQ